MADENQELIEVYGARENNLKNIDLIIPRQKLVVITGISGSGKSSLAFDTIYAEGQRRYMESFSAYARNFIGEMERPNVDKINGLSPVISIEQKTTSKNPRSTVGTTTEVYDFLRLLYARTAVAYSYNTGKPMIKQSEDQIIDLVLEDYLKQKIAILAPVVKGRKGHYRELFVQIVKKGYNKVRVDGEIIDITPKLQLDRFKIHDIEIVVDRLIPDPADRYRLSKSIKTALSLGDGSIFIENEKKETRFFSKNLTDPETGISYEDPSPNSFSFNSPYGTCPVCKGLGVVEEISIDNIIPDKNLSISAGGIAPLGSYRSLWIFKQLEIILKKFKANISTPIKDIPEEAMNVILYGSDEPVAVPSKKYPGEEWNTNFEGIIQFLKKQQDSDNDKIRDWIQDYLQITVCPECNGGRLKKESLSFKLDNKNISELSLMDISELYKWFDGIESRLNEKQNQIAASILKEIRKRLEFLYGIGLDYLTLDRPLRTLSGGEAQRIRLATQIGIQLVGVLYIMDEPSIGLHQRDNVKLIKALQDLRDLGNSVLVVEHDKDMMLESDYIIDIGPGAGRHGGKITNIGPPKKFMANKGSTANFLAERERIEVPKERRKGNGKFLKLSNATGNNLKNITLKLPLGVMTAVTGVSGSGKSTLVHDTLYPILRQSLYNSKKEPLPYKKIEGMENLDKVIEVDQTPIGRTPRSNPATYTGMFTHIRELFSQVPEAKIRGYKPGRFSFNVKGGRCEECGGAGKKKIEMDFLPDVFVECQVCKGKRFNRETLEIRFKSKSISDILDMTVEDAYSFFEFHPKIFKTVQVLNDVGLGYITLGQHATTLSGGEAQRVKLAEELSKRDTGKTLYILDEPTTGLHFEDIRKLLDVLQKLTDKGNTVLIIEHNLDVIKVVDHVVDIGPEGGAKGGQIIAEGTPEEVSKSKKSYTGHFLAKELA